MENSLLLDDLALLGQQIDAALNAADAAPLQKMMSQLWAIALVYDPKTFAELTKNADG